MQPLRGILFKVLSVCMFMGMASLIKAASSDVPPGEAVFFRSFFAIPIILGWLAIRGELTTGWRTSNPLGHFWRGLVGTTARGLGFTGLGLLPLPEVTALGYAAPLVVRPRCELCYRAIPIHVCCKTATGTAGAVDSCG